MNTYSPKPSRPLKTPSPRAPATNTPTFETPGVSAINPAGEPLPARIFALQHSAGNRATLQLLRSAHAPPAITAAAPPHIMRALMPLAEWRAASAISDSGQRIRGPRSWRMRTIDSNLDRFNRRRGYARYEFGHDALTSLQDAITAFLGSRSTSSSRVGHVRTLQTAAAAEAPIIQEMRQIRDRLRDNFGITLDNATGLDAIRRFYGAQGASRTVLRQLRESPWEVNELRQIDNALTIYTPLLGANRPGALGAQTITTFSRLRADIEGDMSSIEGTVNPESTFAETFTQRPNGRQLSNISMFNHAGSVMDFVADRANPTPQELERGYRGTVIHELSHGLIEMLPNPPLPAPAPAAGGAAPAPGVPVPAPAAETFPDGTAVTNMIEHFANQMSFWTDMDTPSGDPAAEAPITGYGQTSPNEDLAEALMFYFEDPARLQRQCPNRWAFINAKLTNYLNPASVQAATQAARDANPDLNPPPPPAPGTAPAAPAPTGSAITPEALQTAAGSLRPVAAPGTAGPSSTGPAPGTGSPAPGVAEATGSAFDQLVEELNRILASLEEGEQGEANTEEPPQAEPVAPGTSGPEPEE